MTKGERNAGVCEMPLEDAVSGGSSHRRLFDVDASDAGAYVPMHKGLKSAASGNKHGAVGQWTGITGATAGAAPPAAVNVGGRRVEEVSSGSAAAHHHPKSVQDLFIPRPQSPLLALPYVNGGSVSGGAGVEDLFSNLKLEFDRADEPHSWSSTISRPASSSPRPSMGSFYPLRPLSTTPSPPSAVATLNTSTSMAQSLAESIRSAERDPAFKNDLAHVLIWFNEDLTSHQRLMTAYTLAQNLSPWQMEILQDCLWREVGPSAGGDPVPAGPYIPPANTSPADAHPIAFPSSGVPSPPSSTTSQNRSLAPGSRPLDNRDRAATIKTAPAAATTLSSIRHGQFDDDPSVSINSPLFHSDFVGWLRLHRLHKYQGNFKGRHDSRAILALSDNDLESLGISALGARRKFLRLFEAIKEHE